jgi:hypothetical protein
MLYKDYDLKFSFKKNILAVRLKGLGAKKNWFAVNRQSYSDSDFVVSGKTNSRWTIPFTSKKTMSMLFVEIRICRTFFALGDCGLFHCDDWRFVSNFRRPLWS